MSQTKYPTIEEALYLHAELLQRFGGTDGVIDLGLLDSALARPRSGYYRTLSEQAAALLHSLAKNHSFVDGNKRVAFALTAIFLLLNGYRLDADPDSAESFMLEVAAGKTNDLGTIATWIEKRITAIKS